MSSPSPAPAHGRRAALALVFLLGLTAGTWGLVESQASPWMLAAVALAKCAVVGVAFLELDRAHPAVALSAALLLLAIAGGAAFLTLV